jgi:hypothetical protein
MYIHLYKHIDVSESLFCKQLVILDTDIINK